MSTRLSQQLLLPVLLVIVFCTTVFAVADTIRLSNDLLTCEIVLVDSLLESETLRSRQQPTHSIQTDGGFLFDLMWTGWRPPGKQNNADNPLLLGEEHFRYMSSTRTSLPNGGEELSLYLSGINSTIQLRLDYRLEEGDNWLRRRVALRDTTYGRHFLRVLFSREGALYGDREILKPGAFGQPIALSGKESGIFLGLEDPASRNSAAATEDCITISCSREIGQRISTEWFTDEWTVLALTPDNRVQHWFNRYLADIRVTPLRPYTLYNSWYDLRSAAITDNPLTVMNEENTLRVIGKLRHHMIEGQDIKLDAFVLDDGWDIYASDWELRREEFPRGLLPISAALQETDTDLGIWFSPIGGYSRRDQRINWMREHGYETVGSQLCLAGTNYYNLFEKRVTEFVAQSDVGFFKWDGIQFSCSEPDHGHPVGIYSRRAVLDAVKNLCHAVRRENPDVYLNITSGTWLSPWWVKYANQIWMDGYDFGWADVPSISQRDAAITYRDMTLFEDFHTKNLWFPIGNLMTHGIIKGYLQQLGGSDEPLDKFTDNALLYFARGVSMWELYISPDILTDGEWNAISSSIHWARDRFELLDETFMIGGDPGKRQPYGYAHCEGERAVIVLRNSYIAGTTMHLQLASEWGLDPGAADLVLERTYPTRHIATELYAAGDDLTVSLNGYETAVFELYPLAGVSGPLVTGVQFETLPDDGAMNIYPEGDTPVLLYASGESRLLDVSSKLVSHGVVEPLQLLDIATGADQGTPFITVELLLDQSLQDLQLALLLETAPGLKQTPPEVTAQLDQEAVSVTRQGDGGWSWYSLELVPGQLSARFDLVRGEETAWQGQASLWLIGKQQLSPVALKLDFPTGELKEPLPPAPWPQGQASYNRLLLEVPLAME